MRVVLPHWEVKFTSSALPKFINREDTLSGTRNNGIPELNSTEECKNKIQSCLRMTREILDFCSVINQLNKIQKLECEQI